MKPYLPYRPYRPYLAGAGGIVPLFQDALTDLAVDASGTFTRASTAYHKNANGVWVPVASGAPRFSGATWSGSAWSGTATGLLMEQAATNVGINSLPGQTWPNTSTGGSGTAVATTGLDGAESAKIFTDANAAAASYWRTAGTTTNQADSCVYVYWVKQDSDTSRVVGLGAFSSGGSNYSYGVIHLNTMTGQTAVVTQTRCAITVASVLEDGIIKVAISRTISPTLDNTADAAEVIPAAGTVLGTANVAATGSFTLLYYGIFNGATAADVISMSPIVTGVTAVTRAVDALTYSGISGKDARLVIDGVNVDIDGWNGVVTTPTVPQVLSSVTVYEPGKRPA